MQSTGNGALSEQQEGGRRQGGSNYWLQRDKSMQGVLWQNDAFLRAYA